VALKGKLLAFVEVKQRKRFEDAGWSLPARARRRIVRAAQYWLTGNPDFTGHDIASTWCWPRLGPGLATSPTRFRFINAVVIVGLDPAIHSNRAPTHCSIMEWMPDQVRV
jgi:hypothetical protein